MYFDDSKRNTLIREYRKAKAEGDMETAARISVLLYEQYGWKEPVQPMKRKVAIA